MIYHAYETRTCKRQQLLVFLDANDDDEAFGWMLEASNCLLEPLMPTEQKQSKGEVKENELCHDKFSQTGNKKYE